METREIFSGVNSIKFNQRFNSDEDCYSYIAAIKWEYGYNCKKCNNPKYIPGKKPFSRRCSKCKYDESPTAGTMFDKIKFPLLLAFHIIFKIGTKKKGMSTLELSHEFELRQKTCWEFKWKIQQAMQSSLLYPLQGEVHVDELWIGGPEQSKRGRSKGSKKLVVLGLEKLPDGVGRAYAQVINRASAKEFKGFFDNHISKNAKIVTDEWTGYGPLKKEYPGLEQRKSDEGNGFIDLHIHIMNLKGWLRGIHHHCSKERLQGYLEEYHFRYNRRTSMDTIFESLLKRMVVNDPVRLSTGISEG
jgi:ISXO2-like transposase domain